MSGIDLDPTSSDLIADPHAFYRVARKGDPLFYSSTLGMWVVTRYDDVRAVLASSAFGKKKIAPLRPLTPETSEILRSFEKLATFDTNGREHDRIRHYAAKPLRPSKIAAMEPRVREIARSLVVAFRPQRRTDVVSSFCGPLAATVIFEFLGIPEADIAHLCALSTSVNDLFFGFPGSDEQSGLARDVVEYWRYCVELVEERRDHPGDDLVSDLLFVDDGPFEPLSVAEVVSIMSSFVAAGHHSSTNLMSTCVMWALEVGVEAGAPSAPGSGPWDALVEEALRIDSPFSATRYVALQDAEIGGVPIRADQDVLVVLTSANHDEGLFAASDAWNPYRDNVNKHLAFGFGTHWCLGAPLARLEARVGLEVLFAELPDLRIVTGDRTYEERFTTRGLRSLEIGWSRAIR